MLKKAEAEEAIGLFVTFLSLVAFHLGGGQARSQDLEKGGGGFFERVRKVQTTLIRIFIVLESVSHGLSQN